VSLLLVLVLMLAAVIFAVQNATTVTITVFFWRLQASLATIAAVCVLVGALGGLLVSIPRLYRMRADRRRLRTLLADLAAEDVPDKPTGSRSSNLKLRSPQARRKSNGLTPGASRDTRNGFRFACSRLLTPLADVEATDRRAACQRQPRPRVRVQQ
jgi:uncharacterized integral membrane protein